LPYRPHLARAGAASLLGAIVVSAALIGVAMVLYPGGTAAEPHALRHSFWLNYLCDLTSDLTVIPYAGGAWHAPTILLTAVPGLVASSAAFAGLVRAGRRLEVLVAMGAILTGVTDAVLYATRVSGGLPETSPSVPLVQRLTVLSLLAWMGVVGWAVLRDSSLGRRTSD
jgi:hypothetical protein